MHWRGKHAIQKIHTWVVWYFVSPGLGLDLELIGYNHSGARHSSPALLYVSRITMREAGSKRTVPKYKQLSAVPRYSTAHAVQCPGYPVPAAAYYIVLYTYIYSTITGSSVKLVGTSS